MIDLDGGFYRGGYSVGRAEGIVEGLTQGISQGIAQEFTKGLNRGIKALKDLGLSPEIIESFIKLYNADKDKATQD